MYAAVFRVPVWSILWSARQFLSQDTIKINHGQSIGPAITFPVYESVHHGIRTSWALSPEAHPTLMELSVHQKVHTIMADVVLCSIN
jgi:hypothetical protein